MIFQTINPNFNFQDQSFWSYGFRPFFFSAAIFVGIAIPAWVLFLFGAEGVPLHYFLREWHVHEMVFGFLSSVIAGFILTAIPNWTERSPMRGSPLMLLWTLWLVGRLSIALSWLPPLVVALIDGAFLVVVATIVWRDLLAVQAWDRLPMGVLISLYASANLLFHGLFLKGVETGIAERMALMLIMMLLAMIGGKITPGFTEDYFEEERLRVKPVSFSGFDQFSILLVAVAGILWVVNCNSMAAGVAFIAAGLVHFIRLSRWYGWFTWRELLVLILHVGYGWLALSFLLLGSAILDIGMHKADALHALTTGAVGVMTLAVMTRASLGHTGRVRHAGPLTLIIYLLVNLGAVFRVFGPGLDQPGSLALAAGCWSGAYLLFAIGYGPILFGRSLENT